MSRLQNILAVIAGLMALLALALPYGQIGDMQAMSWNHWPLILVLLASVAALIVWYRDMPFAAVGVLAALGGVVLMELLPQFDYALGGYWAALVAFWAMAWLFAERLSRAIAKGKVAERPYGILIPLIFGAAILTVWEAITLGANIPKVLLPAPSAIWDVLLANVPILVADFQQTFIKAVLIGYGLGCGVGFAVAIAIDRSPFLKAGLLPLGNFVSALPLIGIAPIMVMWFGFDWPSKAAVVVIMTFFPMLVNTIAGLNGSGEMERDLMRTYAAGYWQTLFKLRLPAAAPFIFNALKINSTLALIGAIVAEFFGTPIVGMGFRISSEIGKLNVDMVWAEIAMAAVAGSVFYWVVVLIERAVTFWHPSVRGGRA
ncbi:ABC transporter permease [Devosia rhodophyticola]|uniref:ABC transporter permease n=2 Tax=Devosia rhodophyticola TaxID=3026423 RepID=A0ABY7Z0W7_9HYPH|nr:ABC transporter permease [Devosia rhodophyticola]WDR07177.1 ABC transporter permease [Devosia rhodophyticola]